MQTKRLLLGLVCYSITFPLYADDETPPSPKNNKPPHVVSSSPTSTKKNLTIANDSSSSNKSSKEVDTEALIMELEEEENPIEECELSNPSSFRLSILHREANGIGYDQGYTSVDGFFAFTSIKNWHPFFDIRTHFFNDGRVAANAGFGIRYQPDSLAALFGLNGFFDFRHTHSTTFEQAGIGVEALGSKWEARANGYFPIINRDTLYDVSFTGFSGHNALFAVKREVAFKGFDLSLGRTLFRRQHFSLSSILGGYMFFAHYDKEAKGGLFKLKTDLSRYFSLEAQASYDTLFKGILQGQAALNIPFGKRVKARKKGLSCATQIALADRITERVDRFEIIVTDHHNTQTAAIDPRTGEDLYIVFVDNTKSGGDGTSEAPYSTLQAAQNNSAPGEMIYVYGGNGTSQGMNSGIFLQDRQWLQASSKSFIALTPYGLDTIPAQTTIVPTISNIGGATITLANDNIVTGLNLTATTYAIYGSHISNFTGTHNNLRGGSLYDFWFNEVDGNITLANNNSYSKNGLSLTTTRDVTLIVKDNLFSNQGSQNMALNFQSISNSTASISFNTFQRCIDGSTISTQNSANLTLNLEDNAFKDVTSTADYALQLSASNLSTLITVMKDNTCSAPTLIGFDFETTDSATSFFFVIDNTSSYSGSELIAYPFNFAVTSAATSNLLLQGNVANSSGYELSNASGSTFNVQSSTLSLDGLESANTGSFTLSGTGTITFISYTPSTIPDLN